ncbi:hypothetical protein PoB_006752800 [Plakobranchus ocellatus]|uniref:Uncharacterized protein n=1 Tax=Plakobranchus ocellatus TaxID=259542 RepID=A0AAV4D9T5_9GAST|nr:hypothetical protein PoB_006752800 [Plakobranchus ocellatus]
MATSNDLLIKQRSVIEFLAAFGRTSLSCQKLDNRALFDEKVIGHRHCLLNMATPSRVARHCILSTNDVTQTSCSS